MSEAPTRASTAAELLRRSLDRGRLGHAYLFTGDDLGELEDAAVRLAQTVNCTNPRTLGQGGLALDPCEVCPHCIRIQERRHPDVAWVRPESKMRIISIDQTREVIRTLSLRASEASHKVAIFAGADRMNHQAANAFLKTLEEPPAGSILILLSLEPGRLLETILSRCLRLSFTSGRIRIAPTVAQWLGEFAELAEKSAPDLLGRYRLLTSLLTALGQAREVIEARLKADSPLSKYPDADANQREQWEDDLTAAIEAEYRRTRGEYLDGLEAWLRDVWMVKLSPDSALLFLNDFRSATKAVADRIAPVDATKNLDAVERTRRALFTNAQEALILEVGLLRLKL
jgi:DNA polymerase-3 subunit delta'